MIKLRPDDAIITPEQLAEGQASLVKDSAWASLTGALSGGVILAAFAIELGAGPAQMGLLAAIPFMAQVAQLPAIAFVERVRQRRKIGVLSITAARVLILALAALPFVTDRAGGLAWLLIMQCGISSFVAFGSCAVNAWLHDLIPHDRLGGFFARRLFWGTALACVGTLGAGLLVERLPTADRLQSFAWPFAAAALTGFASSFYLARAPEPPMGDAGPAATMAARLRAPLEDRNFRRLLVFSAAWNIASNIAAPFLTVYLIRQLGYPLTTVTALWTVGQVANALTLYLWGRLTDRFSNKAVLAVALPAYFACTLSLVFSDMSDSPRLELALLVLLHAAMGTAGGGAGLASGNLGLKLAPRGQSTAYLAAIGMTSAVAGGLAPMAGGAIAQWFEASRLSFVVRWESSGSGTEATMLTFAHWDFLFALSSVLGLYVLHALSRIDEGEKVSERLVIQEFGLEALRAVNQLSSIGGFLGGLFPFLRLSERRRFRRRPPS